MTIQEAEMIIDEIEKSFRVAFVKSIIIGLVGFVLIFFLTPVISKICEDFQYWLDCKKYDREQKKLKKA